MSILKKPLVTEKVSALNEKGKYGFIVDVNANKVEIKKAVEDMYGVTVEDVNTMKYQGKAKSRYTKSRIVSGRTNSFKKAIVTVAEGEVIDFYSGI
ncbi:LSU ribosomal protein L23P [Roseivirga pacifica]|jgi:large subunit ribosomal protein L23|uniref:Large ribosomal subunit protein uL23 n=1 Tax=Roseivirga pacifica TaxID=1267423 RepID=A0A1I0NYK0_9BACT|nr:50S ribosomal protein L23 [Roseivirga pacifica]MCO6360096.1 50S ribosomal protein L23 [Roseivirga pacifica]MCO6367467.1 50S ribosomal protein L23 [Roseivirga pacifica]MCO6370002.1 50S ribosomal protein L23 [Roseivirga pacifica]MCO6375123.1 50S ribosomal protein L23 [Roseivirga pacifica]MCO6380382.1 50S ribosomal protein L23 [Roseivirga pacifica]